MNKLNKASVTRKPGLAKARERAISRKNKAHYRALNAAQGSRIIYAEIPPRTAAKLELMLMGGDSVVAILTRLIDNAQIPGDD